VSASASWNASFSGLFLPVEFRGRSVCLSVCPLVTKENLEKKTRLTRSRCCLGWWVGWAQGNVVLHVGSRSEITSRNLAYFMVLRRRLSSISTAFERAREIDYSIASWTTWTTIPPTSCLSKRGKCPGRNTRQPLRKTAANIRTRETGNASSFFRTQYICV